MPRQWRRGPDRRYFFIGLVLAVILGLGWVFGTRIHAIQETRADLLVLQEREGALHGAILALRQKLAEARLPDVVEREARAKLRWGFPDEERIVIVRR